MQGAATINQEIDCLEAEWRKHRFAAISQNEPPQGFNRRQASRLEVQIQALKRRQHQPPNQTHSLWKALGLLTYGVLIASLTKTANFEALTKALITPTRTPLTQAQGEVSVEKPAQIPSFEWPQKDAIPTAPVIPDPALSGRVPLGGVNPEARLP